MRVRACMCLMETKFSEWTQYVFKPNCDKKVEEKYGTTMDQWTAADREHCTVSVSRMSSISRGLSANKLSGGSMASCMIYATKAVAKDVIG